MIVFRMGQEEGALNGPEAKNIFHLVIGLKEIYWNRNSPELEKSCQCGEIRYSDIRFFLLHLRAEQGDVKSDQLGLGRRVGTRFDCSIRFEHVVFHLVIGLKEKQAIPVQY